MMEKEKRILITGASSGIGKVTAELLLQQNCIVTIVARNEEKLKEIKEKYPNRTHLIVANVADDKECKRIIEEAASKMGGIDVLINNAGTLGPLGSNIESTSLSQWNEVIATNLNSVFILTQLSIPYLEKVQGCIVNVSSIAATRTFPNCLPYSVSKAALDQLTKCSALELAPKKIRVNSVNPATVITDIYTKAGMEQQDFKQYLEECKQSHPLGRVGTPEDVANMILFLISEKASWITGGIFPVDGGRNLVIVPNSNQVSNFGPKKLNE